ncbi:MAG TPA: energy transducer TonB [Myxococcales bacterium]|nr:energy transducer TonB [Myxococcales bacterium]
MLLAGLLAACAHAPKEQEVSAVETVHTRAEVGEDQVPPVRKGCRGKGPRIPEGETVTGVVQANYLIGADGKVTDVKVTGKGSALALKAIQRFIASCTYTPALREGKPVAVRWRGELDFTRAPASR